MGERAGVEEGEIGRMECVGWVDDVRSKRKTGKD